MPVTRVIGRYSLQQILVEAVERYGGPGTVMGNAHVISHNESSNGKQVTVTLEDGRTFEGDLLIGADGIWSKIRQSIVGETKANYSGYTCYTGISDYCPADIDVVGYRVFLGNGQYFVSSDVGGGKMQWYAFNKEPAGGKDEAGARKERLLGLFGHWCDNVTDLIKATPEEDVLRRDIFDRPPIFNWTKGRVALLGDSAHAMQPNLGQGGCMAIEDAYQLGEDIAQAITGANGNVAALDVPALLRGYQGKRLVRAAAIHGMAGMAAFMASTYKAYLGEGLGPLSSITQFKVPHPGRVAGQAILKLTMPGVLDWVLGGNIGEVERSRAPHCKLGDQPKGFHESQFGRLMRSDEELVSQTRADWLLLAERTSSSGDACSSTEAKGVYISEQPTYIGREASAGCTLLVPDVQVGSKHAKVWKAGSEYYIRDLNSRNGTYINGHRVEPQTDIKLKPSDVVEFARQPAAEVFKVKLQHVSLRTDELHGYEYTRMLVGRRQEQVQQERDAAAQQQPVLSS
jgi:zeaxanthin epoxidase